MSGRAVFLRGVNVGGRVLKTAALAEDLAGFDVVNVGAAGTFAVLSSPSASRLAVELRRRIPFPVEMAIVDAARLRRAVDLSGWGRERLPPGERWAVSFLTAPAAARPPLPLERPSSGPWQVRLLEFDPPMVLSRRRRREGERLVYPNEVVEREFGAPATTRWWETVVAVHRAFAPGSAKKDESTREDARCPTGNRGSRPCRP